MNEGVQQLLEIVLHAEEGTREAKNTATRGGEKAPGPWFIQPVCDEGTECSGARCEEPPGLHGPHWHLLEGSCCTLTTEIVRQSSTNQ